MLFLTRLRMIYLALILALTCIFVWKFTNRMNTNFPRINFWRLQVLIRLQGYLQVFYYSEIRCSRFNARHCYLRLWFRRKNFFTATCWHNQIWWRGPRAKRQGVFLENDSKNGNVLWFAKVNLEWYGSLVFIKMIII